MVGASERSKKRSQGTKRLWVPSGRSIVGAPRPTSALYGPAPTGDVKTRTPRSVGTCDRLQRPRAASPARPRCCAGRGEARAEAREHRPGAPRGARADAQPHGRGGVPAGSPASRRNETERGDRGRRSRAGATQPCGARTRARPGVHRPPWLRTAWR